MTTISNLSEGIYINIFTGGDILRKDIEKLKIVLFSHKRALSRNNLGFTIFRCRE